MDKTLYRCREVSLTQSGTEYTVRVAGATPDLDGTLGPFTNPLEAWHRFIVVLDDIVRCRIGDMLEQQGRNRYTGDLLPDAEQLEL